MIAGEVIAERFEILELAQAGGMGAVYRARDRLTGEQVAVKVARDVGSEHDDRFLREAALLAELRHPAIVRHVAHGRAAGGVPYLAMEWLDGEDLARRLTRGPLPPTDAIALVRRVAEALTLLHGRGGLHRDLKPANLFLEGGRADRVKLVYFDGTGVCLLAKRLEDGKFVWPAITDGVVRLTAAQLQALLEGLDWRRVHDARETRVPVAAS